MSIHTAISRVAASFAALVFFTSPLLGQDWAKEKLEKSPRHGEWVEVKHGDRNVRCFLVFPEVKEKAAPVLRRLALGGRGRNQAGSNHSVEGSIGSRDFQSI